MTKFLTKVPINQNETNWINGTELLSKLLMYGSVLAILFLTTYDFRLNRFILFTDSTGKGGEGKIYIGSINRAQQAYFIEEGFFANSLEPLGIGLKPETNRYSYQILAPMGPVQTDNQVKIPSFMSTIAIAQPKITKHIGYNKTYIGIVFTIPDNLGQLTTVQKICESKIPNYPIDTLPVLKKIDPIEKADPIEIECPLGFQVLK